MKADGGVPRQPDGKWRLALAGDMSTRRAARAAGIWYALLAALSILGGMVVDARFFASGDASVVMTKIQAEGPVYGLGIASFLAGQVCQVFVMLALYRMFRSVDRDQARAMFAFVVTMVSIAFVAALGKFAPLILLGDAASVAAFEPAQLQALSMLFIELQNYGIIILEIFWGLWLLPLGLLVTRSGLFPKSLGILLIIGCAGHIMLSFTAFVPSDARSLITQAANVLILGELPFFLWLIVFGARNLVNRDGRLGTVSAV